MSSFDIFGGSCEFKFHKRQLLIQNFKRFLELIRWDSRETEQLPECMKMCFQVLYNTTCEIAHEIEKENGWNQVLPQLTKVVRNLSLFCFVFLLLLALWKDHPTLAKA